MEDVSAIDYRALFASSVRKDRRADMEPALEAFSLAWRPAGARSLGDRWLRAGEADLEPAAPPRPPAPPAALKLKRRRIKR